jgi:hypothetical protein
MKYDAQSKAEIICLHKKVFLFLSELGRSKLCVTCRKTVYRDMSTYPERNCDLLKGREHEIVKPSEEDYKWIFKK